MKKVLAVLTVLGLSLGFSSAAWAGVIMVKNNTGVEIVEMFISSSGTNSWEEDVLGRDTLSPGETLRITVNGSYNAFDLRITDGEDALEFYRIDGRATNITLNRDGTASY